MRTVPLLKSRQAGDWQWHEPRAAADEELLRAHSREHLARVANASQDFDLDTPAYPNIDFYARQSAGGRDPSSTRSNRRKTRTQFDATARSSCMRDRAMGFCSFSNIAVAALDALAEIGVAHAGPRPTTAATGRLSGSRSGTLMRIMATAPRHRWRTMKELCSPRFSSTGLAGHRGQNRLPMFRTFRSPLTLRAATMFAPRSKPWKNYRVQASIAAGLSGVE